MPHAEQRAIDQQRTHNDRVFEQGPRSHVVTEDPLTRWLVRWPLTEAVRRARAAVPDGDFGPDSRILVLCAGDGLEGTVLCDMGFRDVTVSDISPEGVRSATERDPRLQGMVLNAQDTGLEDESYDWVIVQAGLHHLPQPVAGYAEMLRLARRGVIFLEPHDSLVGRRFGLSWEDVGNFVFRWDRRLLEQVTYSYLGPDSFRDLSYTYWHHNIHMERLGQKLGGGERGIRILSNVKNALDRIAPNHGNKFCGLVIKTRPGQRAEVTAGHSGLGDV